ncbi:hypothetical protein [Streptomyces sp. NPDC037389]|uniref:hypothetical protein n=1 Tax=Streptomyces sp. NPDC037389 TaxID=3155369 RepID=UPI0034096660
MHTSTHDAAELHRATQLGAVRTIEALLRDAQIPAVTRWEILPDGLIRGCLALPASDSQHLKHAVRALYRQRSRQGAVAATHRRPDGALELAARFTYRSRLVELWGHLPPTDDADVDAERS